MWGFNPTIFRVPASHPPYSIVFVTYSAVEIFSRSFTPFGPNFRATKDITGRYLASVLGMLVFNLSLSRRLQSVPVRLGKRSGPPSPACESRG